MRKSLTCLGAVAAFSVVAASASADLLLEITGVAGDGFTTWTFSGTGITEEDGTVRDSTGTTYSDDDTTQFGTGDGIADASLQDAMFALTGDASLSVGGTTELITNIFLDDDGVGAGDDLGIRVANPIPYGVGEAVSWQGSGTVPVDITQLVEGVFDMDFGNLWGLDGANTDVIIKAVVPAPGAFALLGVAGLAARRRRRG